MVKSRKTTLGKARPLPDLYSIQKTHSGAIVSKRFSAEDSAANGLGKNGGGSSRSMGSNSATGFVSKRVIFPHLSRLHHGILRYRNVSESPTSVANSIFLGTDNDRRFVFVPAGYSIQNDKSLHEILLALHLNGLPPLVIVTAATDGAVEETVDEEAGKTEGAKSKVLGSSISDLDLTEDQERELLKEKTQEILRSTVSLCGETGAWILPHRPRRVNGAAETLCDAVSAVPQEAESGTGDNGRTKNKAVVLGMIGLDQQDEQDGFTELITSHMHPIGSEIEQVAVVSYDPNVRDNTPCPELTHVLLFQRRQEMRAFRERLLAHTPDVFLAFGRTTPYAKKCLFSTLVDQSPVALITHTSPEIDHMSWMLRHADREIRKIEVGEADPPLKGTATFAVSSDPTTYATLPLPPLPELSGDPELADFLPIWPASHRDERMVLADPRRVGGLQFQRQLLRAVNAAFYIPEARAIALQESSDLLAAVRTTSSHQNKITHRYHLAMVLASLSAVVAAVMYAKIFGADPAPSWNNLNPRQIALFLFTVGVPFSILYMKKLCDESSRLWSQLQNEAALLESTIFHFRTRPRTFGQQAIGSASGSHQGDPEPLDAFIRHVCEILNRVSPFVGEYGNANATGEKGKSQADTETKSQAGLTYDIEANSTYDIEAPPATESSPLLPSAPSASFPELAVNGSTSKWKKKAYCDDVDHINDGALNQNEEIQPEAADHVGASSLLTIKTYIECRIKAGQQKKKDELALLEKRHNTIELIIKLVLGSTSLLALLSKQWFIPIALGVSAAFVASQDFRKYKTRMEQGQAMIQKLVDLLSWWDALGEDKILVSNEDRLVETAEGILVADDGFTY